MAATFAASTSAARYFTVVKCFVNGSVERIRRQPRAVLGRMATDFRDGKTFPRRGRESLGGVLWLARISDKARAATNGTIHDYIYPCPMDQGVMQRWGITPAELESALRSNPSDNAMLKWLQSRTTQQQIEAANEWLLSEKIENLDRQDAEEGAGATA